MRKIAKATVIVLLIFLAAGCDDDTATGPNGDDLMYYYSDSEITVGDNTMLYTMAIPDDYDSDGTPYPLVLALHYGGTPHSDYPKEFLSILALPGLIDLNAVIAAPLTPVLGSWENETTEDMIKAMLDDIIVNYNINANKVIVMGYSLGAMGTWYMTAKMPERFAAAVAVSGMPDDAVVPLLQDVPLYVIHSTVDEVFPYNDVEDLVNQLQNDGKDVTLNSVSGYSHYETARFADPLKQAIPWIQSKW